MWLPLSLLAKAVPSKAQLSLSLPPLVKYISFGSALTSDATLFLDISKAFFASLPNKWKLDAFPKVSVKYGIISSTTSFLVGVVAE